MTVLRKSDSQLDREESGRVNALAMYNAERSRGLLHTAGWQAHMADEQRWFDGEYTPAMWARMGYEPDPSAGPFRMYRKVSKPRRWWNR